LVATVDLPTPPLPLATTSTARTPGMGWRPRGAPAGRAMRTTSTVPAPGMAATAARTAASIVATTSSCAVVGASFTVTPDEATSMSWMSPNETMSRVKPG
jgi:hypothetical protein